MTPERWQKAKAIFQRALDLPAAERAGFVADACGDDRVVRAEVDSLLAEHGREDGFSLETLRLPAGASRGTAGSIDDDDPAGLVGTTLDDTYRVVRLLGRGGMGVVYLAEHALLGDRVAVKLLPARSAAHADAFRRFLREGRMARAVRHPNVVAVHELRTSDDGLTYMVMEYVEGPTLRDELRRRGTIPLDEAVDLLAPVAVALDHAHGLGVVHRDLKPENVIVGAGPDGPAVKLLDLGLARLFEDTDAGASTNVTSAGQVIGTPIYMPPEQWGQLPEDGGSEIDARADVYSLAVMLFELVAGRPPFEADSARGLRLAHARETPPALAALVPAVPRRASDAIARALSKDRSGRPSSAGDLLAEIRTGAPQRRGSRLAKLVARVAVGIAVRVAFALAATSVTIFVGLYVAGKLGGASPGSEPRPAATAPAPVESALRLSLFAERARGGATVAQPFAPADARPFADGDGLRVEASSSRDGYLYVLNEAPGASASPRYALVFPKPGSDPESARVRAGSAVRVPERTWIRFFGASGRETLWVVWSATPVAVLEDAARRATPAGMGKVSDAARVEAIRVFLSSGAGANARPSSRGNDLELVTTGDAIVYPLTFDHR